MRMIIFAVALFVLSPGQQTDPVERRERFELFNRCRPMDLIVEGLPGDAVEIGLTRTRIQTIAESRLRAARLYDEDATPYLYVRVGVQVSASGRDGMYTAKVSYRKSLWDSVSIQSGTAETWDSGAYGMHDGDAGYIVQEVSEHLDRFILEYLRVNEDACSR